MPIKTKVKNKFLIITMFSIFFIFYFFLSFCFHRGNMLDQHPTSNQSDNLGVVVVAGQQFNQSSNSTAKVKRQIVLKNRFKMALQQGFIQKIGICYERFRRCSVQLSAKFCASPTNGLAFYMWAHKYAYNIMNGGDDGYGSSVKCYPGQVIAMAKVLNIGDAENQAMFHLCMSIGKRLKNSDYNEKPNHNFFPQNNFILKNLVFSS